MRYDEYRHLTNAITSLESSTFCVLRHRTLRVEYDRRNSNSVSKQSVSFAEASDIGDMFYIANTKHALLLAPAPSDSAMISDDPAPAVSALLELETEYPHLTAFGATVPARLLGEPGPDLTGRSTRIRDTLVAAFGWEAVRRLFQVLLPAFRTGSDGWVESWQERDLVTLACTRPRLLGWTAAGRPILAQRGRDDEEVRAEALAADERDAAAAAASAAERRRAYITRINAN